MVDGSNNYTYIGGGKRKKVATMSVLLQSSGSVLTVPEVLSTATLAAPWSNDVSGNFAVTGQPEVVFKNDDGAIANMEVTQWITATGTLP